jgi:hypothetical protein
MRIATRKADPTRGSIDGGTGRGVPIDRDEDEGVVPGDDDAFAVLDEENDAEPGDRRRDPLRRK